MAKDLLAKYINIFVDDSGATARNLSGDLVPGTLAGIGEAGEEIQMHGQNEDVYYMVGAMDGDISAQFHMNDTATTGAHTVLIGILGGAAGTITVEFGSAGVPDTDDPDWEGEYVLSSLVQAINSGRNVLNATFKRGDATGGVWGTKT